MMSLWQIAACVDARHLPQVKDKRLLLKTAEDKRRFQGYPYIYFFSHKVQPSRNTKAMYKKYSKKYEKPQKT